jgi:hypothetical protein
VVGRGEGGEPQNNIFATVFLQQPISIEDISMNGHDSGTKNIGEILMDNQGQKRGSSGYRTTKKRITFTLIHLPD